MDYPYILTADQAELVEDALRFYRRHHDEQAERYGNAAGYKTDAEYVIDEIDTLLPLLNNPREVKIIPSTTQEPSAMTAPRLIHAPTFSTYIKVGAVSDGTEAAIRHGIALLEARFKNHADRRFRIFIEDLNTTIQNESTYRIAHRELSDREVFEALTVVLRVAQQHVPDVINDPLP